MQKLFDEVASLDKRCYDEFFLNEDILMEHASSGMADYIHQNFKKNSKVTIVCGSGNNGADGIALARLLHANFDISIFYAKKPSSKMALLQQRRTQSIGVKECIKLEECDVLVDAIVGTGFCGELSGELLEIIDEMNRLNAFKISCDMPSGFAFRADVTLTMGALKKSLFLDSSKEMVGDIKVINLGVSRDIYETQSNTRVLDLEDLKLPYRDKKVSNKGTYGHLAVVGGEKIGACMLSARAAFGFGSGLVTVVGSQKTGIPHAIMHSNTIPKNATAICMGMGLGAAFGTRELFEFLDNNLPLIADADLFYMPTILEILKRDAVVLTPHPKEFVSLLRITGLADILVDELQEKRFYFAELFCKKFPKVVLLLKGANVIIAQGELLFVNPHGSGVLAKGGSGDVLSGLIGSLLAQGYTPLESAINASLAHVKLALNYTGATFSLTPDDLIDGIKNLS